MIKRHVYSRRINLELYVISGKGSSGILMKFISFNNARFSHKKIRHPTQKKMSSNFAGTAYGGAYNPIFGKRRNKSNKKNKCWYQSKTRYVPI